MWDTAIGFSLISSTIITLITYIATRGKNKSEQEQKDKLNDMIILFIICFMVIMLGKLCLNDNLTKPPSVTNVVERSGGQCPF